MFFYVGDNCPIKSLVEVEPGLYLDRGWQKFNGYYFKGYSTECVLSNSIDQILNGYTPKGKWIVLNRNEIYYPELRGFPVFSKDDVKTNIQLENLDFVPYHPENFVSDTSLTLDEAAEQIGEILVENITGFLEFNTVDDINMLVTAGLDSLTCWAVLDHVTKNYTLTGNIFNGSEKSLHEIMGTVREYESDLIETLGKTNWAYSYISLYNQTNYTIGGYYAEMIQYRDAEALYGIASYKDTHIDQLAEPNDYLYKFLLRPTLDKYKKEKLLFKTEQELRTYLYGTLFHDYQMWHIDNNIFVSPFADARIGRITLGLSLDDILANAVNGIIQRKIIQRYKPDILPLVSDFKNHGNLWKNFKDNFDKVVLSEQTKIQIRQKSS